jgi:hypothetical protein
MLTLEEGVEGGTSSELAAAVDFHCQAWWTRCERIGDHGVPQAAMRRGYARAHRIAGPASQLRGLSPTDPAIAFQ